MRLTFEPGTCRIPSSSDKYFTVTFGERRRERKQDKSERPVYANHQESREKSFQVSNPRCLWRCVCVILGLTARPS
jgi:hypothetical protein